MCGEPNDYKICENTTHTKYENTNYEITASFFVRKFCKRTILDTIETIQIQFFKAMPSNKNGLRMLTSIYFGVVAVWEIISVVKIVLYLFWIKRRQLFKFSTKRVNLLIDKHHMTQPSLAFLSDTYPATDPSKFKQ